MKSNTKKQRVKRNKTVRYRKRVLIGGNPLKVAMFFVGRVTAYKNVLQKLFDIQKRYNPVIFASLNGEKIETDLENSREFQKDFKIPSEQYNLEEIQFPNWLTTCWNNRPINPRAMFSMFYHMNRVFKMIETYQEKNAMKFDCILYYRADIDSSDTLTLSDKLEKNTIYLSKQDAIGGYNDRMAYGDYDSMKIYCNLYNSLESLFCGDRSLINPESILKKYLSEVKLNVSLINYDTRLHPLRKHVGGARWKNKKRAKLSLQRKSKMI
jgi:hypothetical protein